MILGYPSIVTIEILKEWKMAITSVEQEYESTEERQDYRTGSGIIYRDKEVSMNIGTFKDNYNKDGRLRYFNCNVYGHIAKDC